MADNEQLAGLLMKASGEIQALRRRNETLEAVSRTVEIFGNALFTVPPSHGAAVDIVWELNRACDELGNTKPEVA